MTSIPGPLPDDQLLSEQDRHRPSSTRAVATPTTDHARHHQGGGPTGEVGGDRPAEVTSSALAPIDGRTIIPGPDPERLGETHWDAPLAFPIALASPPGHMLENLRDAGDLVSGKIASLYTSAALQETAIAVAKAARTGTEGDVLSATNFVASYLRMNNLV